MIPVFCHTNIDEFKKEEWPKEFLCRPIVGDCVQSKDGALLKIVRIIHCGKSKFDSSIVLDIELHRTV